MVTPHGDQEALVNVPVLLCKIFSTNQDGNLVPLDSPGRVRSHKLSVVCQIQQFDFGCNLVVARKKTMEIPPALRLEPL